jgi:endoglucanase
MCLFLAFCGAGRQETTAEQGAAPRLVEIGPVSDGVLGLTLEAGAVDYGMQKPYSRELEGSPFRDESGNTWIKQGGKTIGALICNSTKVMTLDRVAGEKLDTRLSDLKETYVVTSSDDPDYSRGVSPSTVYRKSKPTDLARVAGGFDAPMEHRLYLRFPSPLKAGRNYTLSLKMHNLPDRKFTFDPRVMRSEAVHVSHIGFRPDDPSKVAFLSLWMGSGGPMDYRGVKKFFLLDQGTGETVYEGDIRLSKAASEKNEDAYNRNFNGTDVYSLDFSSVTRTGAYRIYVEGVGCSYAFNIAPDAWAKAFYVSARGLYHQRSGIKIGPPYTTFERPRNFNPEDGVKVYESKMPLMETGNGLKEGNDAFTSLLLDKTGRTLPNAWGGYCDAGDWDRRIQHLDVARLLMDLWSLFPSYFDRLKLNIPTDHQALPDLMQEALWSIDFFGRIMTEDGGVRGGIESAGHPKYGEASWQETHDVMSYAPDVWSSYSYAGAAARAAHVLGKQSPDLARRYRESALRAMTWAERELKERYNLSYPYHQVKDMRNLASAELFRTTGDRGWHDLFQATTVFGAGGTPLSIHKRHDQSEAAWVYQGTDRPGMNPSLKRNCVSAIIADADARIQSQTKTGYRWMKEPWRPAFAGTFTVPDSLSVIRAHIITGKKEYLSAVVLAAQTGAGANPLNLCYTTGVGHAYPRHVLHMDSRVTRQAPPPGLTVEGPLDVDHLGGPQNPLHMYAGNFCFPAAASWPVIENYWDVFWYPMMCEFTVHQTIAPNAFAWGYLAARK